MEDDSESIITNERYNYISNIITDNNNIISHNKYVNQMDLIRLKGNNFAIIEISESNNDIIYISIYTLYNNDKCLKVRIFEINLDIFDAKFNDILKSFNFNSYLGIGFSPKNSSSFPTTPDSHHYKPPPNLHTSDS